MILLVILALTVDSGKQLLPGRPSGGTAILWRQTLSDRVTPLVTNHKRFSAIELCINAMFKLLLICCYLPCDSRTQDVSNDFRECCDAIEVCMSKQSYAACVIGGDLNVEIMRQTGNSKYFLNFVENNNMQFLWNLDSSNVDYTYESYDGASSSVIDHFVMSNEVAYAVCKGCVVHDVDNLSNHNPIVMECKFDTYGVHTMINNDKCVGNANL